MGSCIKVVFLKKKFRFSTEKKGFGGGKFFTKDFAKFRLHFLPQFLPLVCKFLPLVCKIEIY
jgi:hypothetical protein